MSMQLLRQLFGLAFALLSLAPATHAQEVATTRHHSVDIGAGYKLLDVNEAATGIQIGLNYNFGRATIYQVGATYEVHDFRPFSSSPAGYWSINAGLGRLWRMPPFNVVLLGGPAVVYGKDQDGGLYFPLGAVGNAKFFITPIVNLGIGFEIITNVTSSHTGVTPRLIINISNFR